MSGFDPAAAAAAPVSGPATAPVSVKRRPAKNARGGRTAWDIICVGSGITALAFGAQMARERPDRKILVLEKHYVPGGYASIFKRKSNRFDCSLHKLSGVGPGGNLHRILAGLDLYREIDLVYPSIYFEASARGDSFSIPNDYGAAKAFLIDRFPQDEAGLGRFFEEVEVHGKNGYYQFQTLDGSYLPDIKQRRHAHRELRRITVAEALRE